MSRFPIRGSDAIVRFVSVMPPIPVSAAGSFPSTHSRMSLRTFAKPNRVQIWHAASSSAEPGRLESRCESWLAEEEIVRADRFRVATSRNQHVVGRGMARRLLSGDDVEPRAIRFAFQTHGKPYVSEPEAAQQPFNVAHTDGLVMCGIGSGSHALVGVDVERIGRRTDPALAERYFSPPEVQFLNTRRDEQTKRDTFLRIWTLKESFIKAIGTGLQTPLADFTFVDIESPTPMIEMLNPDLRDNRSWNFFSFQPRPGFIAAVAVATESPDTEIELDVKRFDDWIGD